MTVAAAVREQVRAACDKVAPAEKCKWPACQCMHLPSAALDILTALLDAARAEGAALEREAIIESVDDHLFTVRMDTAGEELADPPAYGAAERIRINHCVEEELEKVLAAIRARAPVKDATAARTGKGTKG